jgi:hypothetical protein
VVEEISDNAPKASRPTLSSDQQTKIDGLLARWNYVQGRLKRAEQISQFAVVPAINELRYAGRMLVAALANAQPNEGNGVPSVDDAIVIAGQYITNAEHDISDALIYFFQKKVDDFNQRFGAGAIRKEYPKYREMLSNLKSARALVIASRADISRRTENYKKLIEITDKVIDEYFALIDGEVLFALEVEHFKARVRMWKQIAAVVTIWAIVATLISFIY